MHGQTRAPGEVAFRREALPPLAELEREWRALEAVARPSFFISWAWIGSLLDAIPAASRPMLLRGHAQGETVALALVGTCGHTAPLPADPLARPLPERNRRPAI